jgi:hypothetical protein
VDIRSVGRSSYQDLADRRNPLDKKDHIMRKVWMLNPHTGGKKIPPMLQAEVRKRINDYAEKNYAGKYTHLDITFRGALCYIDAYQEPAEPAEKLLSQLEESREEYIERLRNSPIHLCRIRHFDINSWSVAFYTYSNEIYSPCTFNGEWLGTVEQAFDIGAGYLV